MMHEIAVLLIKPRPSVISELICKYMYCTGVDRDIV